MSNLETWALQHPDYGLIEVRSGFDADFAEIDPAWPGKPGKEAAGQRVLADAKLPARVRGRLTNPPLRLEVRVNGEVQHQFDSIDTAKLPLFGPGADGTLHVPVSLGTNRSKPHLNIRANAFKDLIQVEFREGPVVVEFDPPPGSRGQRRRDAMASSALKRTAYPMAEGLGKGGWALAVLLLGPILGRFFAWLGGLLPDWQLPEISPPQVDLPVPEMPQVELPTPSWNLPDINVPDMPEWMQWLAEYAEIWAPIIAGVAVGIIALRNHRKSEREKAAWAHRDTDASSSQPRP